MDYVFASKHSLERNVEFSLRMSERIRLHRLTISSFLLNTSALSLIKTVQPSTPWKKLLIGRYKPKYPDQHAMLFAGFRT